MLEISAVASTVDRVGSTSSNRISPPTLAKRPLTVLKASVAGRRERQPGQIAFWRQAHGDDWEQVVEADSALLLRLADRGGGWLGDGLTRIRCPVLFTASLVDEYIEDAATEVPRMAKQVPASEVYLVNAGQHPLMWSVSGAFRRVVDGFLETCAPVEG